MRKMNTANILILHMEISNIKLGFFFSRVENFLLTLCTYCNFRFASQGIYGWGFIKISSNHTLLLSFLWDRTDRIQKSENCTSEERFCHPAAKVLSTQAILIHNKKYSSTIVSTTDHGSIRKLSTPRFRL
jgi:hypothetical protein